jgi:FAD/FMN-containing dehydrogenase
VRKPFIARFDDVEPQAVALCSSPEDVAATTAFATQRGIEVAIRSGGHSFAGYSSTTGIVIDVTPMRSVEVSDESDRAKIGAGARVGEVCAALADHELVLPSGSCPSVGIAGTALGGGLGVLGRLFGLTCDHMLAAEVVLADGRVVTCDAERSGDLLWALRGAGAGNFGVVTSFLFQTRRAPRMTNFYVTWPLAAAERVVAQWQAWAPNAPGELAAGLALTAPDDLAHPPIVEVYGAMVGGRDACDAVLAELIDLVGESPDSDSRRVLTYRETALYQAGLLSAADHVEAAGGHTRARQGCRFTKSEFFREPLPEEAVARLVRCFPHERRPGQYRGLEFAPWGGAYNAVGAEATAFTHRDQLFTLKHALVLAPGAGAGEREAAADWVTSSWESVHPWGSGRTYPNFPDPDLTDWADSYYGQNLARLRRIKARYDPSDLFHFEQSIPA